MFVHQTLTDTNSAISLPELVDGVEHSAWPGGPMIAPSGPAHVPANLSAREAICENCAEQNPALVDEIESDEPLQWLLVSVIEFDDGGEPEYTVLHRGSEEECERSADLIPAVTYKGSRQVARAFLRWVIADGRN